MNFRPVLQFVLAVLGLAIGITGAGAVLGSGLWPLIGALAGSQRTAAELAFAGARDLGFYCFIWAPGIAIVMATIREWRRRHPLR